MNNYISIIIIFILHITELAHIRRLSTCNIRSWRLMRISSFSQKSEPITKFLFQIWENKVCNNIWHIIEIIVHIIYVLCTVFSNKKYSTIDTAFFSQARWYNRKIVYIPEIITIQVHDIMCHQVCHVYRANTGRKDIVF